MLRVMMIEDYSEVYQLWKSIEGIGLSTTDSFENITRFLIRNEGFSFVSLENDKINGAIFCGHDGRRGYIHHLAVDENYRGKGIARDLVNGSLEQLVEAGIDKCHLFVFEKNELGQNFWSHINWMQREDLLVYSKKL